jgi:signal-transduction protein with cAMP-binding, CBS, and nucleotidyltransferase domain
LEIPKLREAGVQGEKGDEFFIISEGQVTIRKDGNVVNTLDAGAFFGERSLIRDDVRAADVVVSATRHLTPTPTPHVWASYLAGGG